MDSNPPSNKQWIGDSSDDTQPIIHQAVAKYPTTNKKRPYYYYYYDDDNEDNIVGSEDPHSHRPKVSYPRRGNHHIHSQQIIHHHRPQPDKLIWYLPPEVQPQSYENPTNTKQPYSGGGGGHSRKRPPDDSLS